MSIGPKDLDSKLTDKIHIEHQRDNTLHNWNFVPLTASSPFPSNPQPLATTIFLSASIWLLKKEKEQNYVPET